MIYRIARTSEEIDNLLNTVQNKIDQGGTNFPGMSFEDGIAEAINWIVGNSQDYPYEG